MVSPFLKLFARSPFKPLSDHMQTVLETVNTLTPFFEAAFAKDWDKASNLQQEISALENKADDLKRDLRIHLPKDLFMPVARSDLLELLSHQDYLANQAKDISGLVLGRKMEFPKPICDDYHQLVALSVDACKQAYKATRELNELLEAGFGGKEKNIIKEMLEKLHVLEHETDELQIKIYHALFEVENDLPAVQVMFLYKIVDWTGSLADIAEKVGDRLQICISQ